MERCFCFRFQTTLSSYMLFHYMKIIIPTENYRKNYRFIIFFGFVRQFPFFSRLYSCLYVYLRPAEQSTSYALDLDFSTYAWCQANSFNDRAIYRFDFMTERRLHSMTIYRHNGIVYFIFLIQKILLFLLYFDCPRNDPATNLQKNADFDEMNTSSRTSIYMIKINY